MSVSNLQISQLRKERGWSQEKLAAISGLSERTIQRVEKDGACSLDTKVALASAFEISPAELSIPEKAVVAADYQTDWAGAAGLFVLGLAFPAVILLTGYDGRWEMVCFFTVIGLTVIMTVMIYGARATHQLFDRTSWIVRYPTRATGLNLFITQANSVIKTAYTVGAVASLITAATLAVHKPEMLDGIAVVFTVITKPLIYAVLLVEFWFRPFKRKLEKMLLDQVSHQP